MTAKNAGIHRTGEVRQPIDLDSYPAQYLFDRPVAAVILGTTNGTLAVWASTGRYDLPFVRIGRRVKYRAGDLREFIERRTATHTGKALVAK